VNSRKKAKVQWKGATALQVVCPDCNLVHQLNLTSPDSMVSHDEPLDTFVIIGEGAREILQPAFICHRARCNFEGVIRVPIVFFS